VVVPISNMGRQSIFEGKVVFHSHFFFLLSVTFPTRALMAMELAFDNAFVSQALK
jgi:hypothetical protein